MRRTQRVLSGNLQSPDHVTEWLAVSERFTSMTIELVLRSGESIGTAVVTAQWSSLTGETMDGISQEAPTTNVFDPTVQLSTSALSKLNVPIFGAAFVRFATTTADATADSSPLIVVTLL